MLPNFNKHNDGLLPAVIQDNATGNVLMLGYMNEESFEQTKRINKVVFFSRSRQKLWLKGETSGNYLNVIDILIDCDADAILIKAEPSGPICHTGERTCFGDQNNMTSFLDQLEQTIRSRRDHPTDGSYTSSLFASGMKKIAQKVGEEAVEVVIESTGDDIQAFKNEAADLLFHTLVLLAAKDLSLNDVVDVLRKRQK